MFLKHVSVDDIRGFEHAEMSFAGAEGHPRKWTFLLGENGTGKSTFLRAIALITAGSEAVYELLGPIDPWIRVGAERGRIQATVQTAQGEERSLSLELRRGASLRDVISGHGEGLARLDDALKHSARSYFTLGYGVARRVSETVVSAKESGGPFDMPRARSVGTLFSADARLTSIESWAMDLDYRRGKEGQDLIRESLDQLLPHVDFRGIDREQRQLMFETPDGEIPYALLSDGYKNMVAWIGDLLYRITEVFEDYRKPLESRGLLLLDEIELHLHPVWQRELIAFLNARLPNFQIVATTHGPLTAHQAGEGELYFAVRDEKRHPFFKHYDGAPNKLLLHQVIRSPIFGLDTLDSQHIHGLREELRGLRTKKRRSAKESVRLAQVRAELEDAPTWELDTPEAKKQRVLLADIQKTLKSLETAAPTQGKRPRKSGGGSKAAGRKVTSVKTRRKKSPGKSGTRKRAVATKKKVSKKKVASKSRAKTPKEKSRTRTKSRRK